MSNAVILANFHPQSWLHTWDNILKKPEELFLSSSIQNIIEYLLRVTENKKNIGNTSFEYELLELLQNRLCNSITERTLIFNTKPNAITKLENLLTNQNHDLKQLRKVWKEIAQGYESTKFLLSVKRLFSDIIKNPNNSNQMGIATNILLRQLLKLYSLEELKKFPSKTFNSVFYKIYKDEIETAIKNDGPLKVEYNKILKITIDGIHSGIRSRRKAKSSIWKDFVDYDGVYWNRDEYYVVYETIKKFEHNLELRKFVNSTKTTKYQLQKFLSKKNNKLFFRELSILFFSKIFMNFFLACSSSIKPLDFSSKFSLHMYNSRFSQIIQPILYSSIPPNIRPGFTFGVAQSFYWTIGKTISLLLLSKTQKIISQESQRLIHIFEDFILNQKIIYEKNTIDYDVYSQMLHSFKFKTELSKFMENIVDTHLDVILQAMKSINFQNRKLSFSKTIFSQLESLFRDLESQNSPPTLPDNMTRKMIRLFYDKLFKEIRSSSRSYRVFSLIGDVDCNGKILKLGNTTFYDSRVWDFGEYKELDMFYDSPLAQSGNFKTVFLKYYEIEKAGRKFEKKRNSGRAFVDVRSKDAESAIQKAVVQIRQSIDTLVFASSAIATVGSNPQLPIHFFIIDRERPFTSSRMGPNPETSDILKIDTEYERIISFYNDIIMAKEGKFEDHIVRAIAWFRTGRWEIIAHEKFLSYWIALEEIILSDSSGDKKKNLIKLIPQLTISWRRAEYGYVIGRLLAQIYSDISQDGKLKHYLNNSTYLKGWEINSQIILKNLGFLKSHCNSKTKGSIERLENHLSNIDLKDLKNEIAVLRNEHRFRTAILYERRNSLVHEGVVYSPEMDLLCIALKSMLVNVLDPVMRLRHKKSIAQIISAYNEPYQVRYRKLI